MTNETTEVMNEVVKNIFYKKLSRDKIIINWNENPIRMSEFLSFLTVEVQRTYDHLGTTTGWTLLENKEHKLRIGGGVVGSVEYLDTIQYGTKLDNSYNDYVNPFYLFDLLNNQGRSFFVDYYKSEIQKLIDSAKYSVDFCRT